MSADIKDKKDQIKDTTEKKIKKSSYSKKKKNQKKYFNWNCLCTIYI